jgi:asparagine synthase (glutamine-hydrolysing)
VCGICGFVGPPDADTPRDVVEAMSQAIRHRGPDSTRVHPVATQQSESPIGGWLASCRLRVIDLTEAGDQPMVSEDGAVALALNGEIYNFRELRRTLEEKNHRFRSTGDTEVALRAYLAWGDDFVERLDGMFSLAVWDAKVGRLLLARDRVGKKPLFYTLAGGRLSFGSEIKALLAAPWVEAVPEFDRLPEFLTFGYVPQPATFYRGIFQVPPASIVSYDAEGLNAPRQYWDALPSDTDLRPGPELDAAIVESLREATAKRLVADVPLGALLSGGTDSAIVVALMAEILPEPVHTFTAGFPDDRSFDERPHARRIADHFGTRHTDFEVQADAVALLDRLLWHHDAPFADSSAIPT